MLSIRCTNCTVHGEVSSQNWIYELGTWFYTMLCCGGQQSGNVRCEVVLLDGSVLSFRDNIHFKKTDKTLKIFEAVCNHLKLEERDYFGLNYNDIESRTHWLDLYKRFRDHEGFDVTEPEHQFHFGVRFYVSDPTSIHDQIAKHQFFLQLQKDVSSGKLKVESRKAADLAAIATQADLGDFKIDFHRHGYLSDVQFVPNQQKSFTDDVEKLHAKFQGLSTENAELMYLRKCRLLELYGVEIHSAKDEYNHDCVIGLSFKGIEVRKNSRKLKTHYWPLVNHIEFKDREIRLQIRSRNCNESVYTFSTSDRTACKRLWKRAIEHHEFFRLRTDPNAPQNPKPQLEWTPRQENLIGGTTIDDQTKRQWRSSTRSTATVTSMQDSKPLRVDTDRGNDSEGQNLLDQQGLFGIEGNRKSSRMYITPKSERRARNRHLRSLSDSENKQNRIKTGTGRSSGDESDASRRHRSRNHRHRSRDTGTGNGGVYHTDTEALKRTNLVHSPNGRKRSETESLFNDGRTQQNKLRKAQNRLSREDVRAQRALWQQIRKQNEDLADYSPEQLNDIPYTEVRTDGNPLPVRVRKHGHGAISPRSRRSRASVTKEYASGDFMVPSLQVTTSKEANQSRYDERLRKSTSKSSLNKYSVPASSQQIWDTRSNKKSKT